MLYPYRNDIRKTLIPYLKSIDENVWYKKAEEYPKSIAWIISHISTSEDFWINEVALKKPKILSIDEASSPKELLKGYINIRNYTDEILSSLDNEQLNTIVEVPKFSDGWTPPSKPTFNWLFQHIYFHEAYHVGQIAIIASMNGFKKPLF